MTAEDGISAQRHSKTCFGRQESSNARDHDTSHLVYLRVSPLLHHLPDRKGYGHSILEFLTSARVE